MKKERYIEVCPHCGSENISARIHYGGKSYMCKDCDYRGYGIVEVEKEKISKFRKIKKLKKL